MGTEIKATNKIVGIELLRFIFAMLIVLGHAWDEFHTNDLPWYVVRQGAIGVEFFFILSGILMAKSVYKEQPMIETYDQIGEKTIGFLKKKYVAIFPTHAIVFLIMFVDVCLVKQWNIATALNKFLFTLPELFLVQMSGLKLGTNVNPNDWYLSSMFLAMLITYPLLRKYRSLFTKVIAPVVTFILLGYLFQTTGKITPSNTVVMGGLFLKGSLRAVAEICLGASVYEVVIYIDSLEMSRIRKIGFGCAELFAYGITLFTACSNIEVSWYFIFLFILAGGLAISFSKFSVFHHEAQPSRIILYLGELSMTIYLSQRVILKPLVRMTTVNSYWINTMIFIIGTVVFSILLKYCIDRLGKLLKDK